MIREMENIIHLTKKLNQKSLIGICNTKQTNDEIKIIIESYKLKLIFWRQNEIILSKNGLPSGDTYILI